VRYKLRVHRMPEKKAVIVDRHVFVAKPRYGLGDILHGFAHRGDHQVIWLCIPQLLHYVRTDMRDSRRRGHTVMRVDLAVMDARNAVLDDVVLGEATSANEFAYFTHSH